MRFLQSRTLSLPYEQRGYSMEYGANCLLDQIGELTGVRADLKVCFPDTYKQILSIAYYLILEDENPLYRFSKWAKLY